MQSDPPTLDASPPADPYAAETSSLGPPIRWRFSFDVGLGPDELWPILIDTPRLNRAMGVARITYVERDGVLHGSARSWSGLPSWVERPWAWVAGRHVASMRVYDRGIATHLVIRFLVEPAGEGRSRFRVEFDWYPRSWWGGLVFRLGAVREGTQRGYERTLRVIEREMAEQRPRHAMLGVQAPPLEPSARERLALIRADLLRDGAPEEAVAALILHVEEGDELDLHRVRARPLARRARVAERDMLLACLRATRAGLLQISWDLICPHCRGVRRSARSLGELPQQASCAVCSIEFATDGQEAVEVTFRVNAAIRDVPEPTYCLAEASSKAHVHVQQPVERGERCSVPTRLPAGRYRVRVAGEMEFRRLDVVEGGAGGQVVIRSGDAGPVEAAPMPVLVLENAGDARCTFVVEDVRWADDAVRPAELFNLQEFRDLFAEEYLASDVQLSVGEQAIVFSDIVGSTAFYERQGDARAFGEVKRHFREVHDVVLQHRGAVVKTIGDANMAAFHDPLDALKAACALVRRFHPDRADSPVRLRVSLNVGPCIAVNLNSGIDYFGQTVNVAAKLQACVGSAQIAFPARLRDDPRVRALLDEERAHIEEIVLPLPWANRTLDVCRWDTARAGPDPVLD
jgi:class 3 adenylate cyclase